MTKINRKEYLNSIKPGQIHWVEIPWDREMAFKKFDYEKIDSSVHKNKKNLKLATYVVENRPCLIIAQHGNYWEIKRIFTLNNKLPKNGFKLTYQNNKTQYYIKLDDSIKMIHKYNFIRIHNNEINFLDFELILKKQLEYIKLNYLNSKTKKYYLKSA